MADYRIVVEHDTYQVDEDNDLMAVIVFADHSPVDVDRLFACTHEGADGACGAQPWQHATGRWTGLREYYGDKISDHAYEPASNLVGLVAYREHGNGVWSLIEEEDYARWNGVDGVLRADAESAWWSGLSAKEKLSDARDYCDFFTDYSEGNVFVIHAETVCPHCGNWEEVDGTRKGGIVGDTALDEATAKMSATYGNAEIVDTTW